VEYAELHGFQIIYHRPDARKGSPRPGYHLLLHKGAVCRVIARAACTMREIDGDAGKTGWFSLSDKYYILTDDVWHAAGNRASVLKALAPYRRELARFIAERKLDFQRNTATAIVETVKEYERLRAEP
jgi:hypothetical protein